MNALRTSPVPSRRFALRLLLALLAGLLASEAALRVLRPRHAGLRSLLYLPHETKPWERAETLEELLGMTYAGFVPNTLRGDFVTSSRGFCTHEYAEEKPAGTLRVVALGDSFAFNSGGVPHASHWPVVLGEELRPRLGRPVEVLALGVNGVGPRFERRLWQVHASRLGADVVVLALFVGNDFDDDGGTLSDEDLVDGLARKSLLVRLLRSAARGGLTASNEARPRTTFAEGGVPLAEVRPGATYLYRPHAFPEDTHLGIETVRLSICDRRKGELFEELFASVSATLALLRDEVAASGAELVVMLIPDEVQVDDELFQAVVARNRRRPEDFDRELPQRRLQAFLAERGIACLDLLPDLRAAGERVYAPRNTHWNPVGNRIAARRLAELVAPLLED